MTGGEFTLVLFLAAFAVISILHNAAEWLWKRHDDKKREQG